jgi:hypothetical protein
MPATTYIATLPDGTTATRRSETMRYTHAVAILSTPHGYMRDGMPIPGSQDQHREGAVWGPTGEPDRWHIEHWCGRIDLAQAKARRLVNSGYVASRDRVQIVEVRS